MAKKKRKKKGNPLILLVILIVVIFFGIKFVSIFKLVLGVGEVSLKKEASIQYINQNDKKATIQILSDYVVKLENNTLSLFDKKGKDLWQRELNIEKAILRQSNEKIIVVDSINGEIIYLDYEGNTLGNFMIGKPIFDVKVDDEGYVLAMTEENEIYVLKNIGEIVSNIKIPKGEVIDGTLSDNHNMMIFTVLNVEENGFYSNLLFYSLEGRVISGKKFDDRIIFKLFFDKNDEILAIGDDRIFKINYEGKILWNKNIEDTINRGDMSEEGILALSLIKKKNPIIDTKNRSIINQMDLDGNIVSKTPVVGDIIGIDINNKVIAACTERTIYLIDDKGKIILEKKINKDIKEVYWISDKNLAVVFRDKVEIMNVNY